MYEFWYQVEFGNEGCNDGGEYYGNTAQECADYVREKFKGYKDFQITSIVRVETEWE